MTDIVSTKWILSISVVSTLWLAGMLAVVTRIRKQAYEISKRGYLNILRITIWAIALFVLVIYECAYRLRNKDSPDFDRMAAVSCKAVALGQNFCIPLYISALQRQFSHFSRMSITNTKAHSAYVSNFTGELKKEESKWTTWCQKYIFDCLDVIALAFGCIWVGIYNKTDYQNEAVCLDDSILVIPSFVALGLDVLFSSVRCFHHICGAN
jgi:hypothetical protein